MSTINISHPTKLFMAQLYLPSKAVSEGGQAGPDHLRNVVDILQIIIYFYTNLNIFQL